MNDFGLSADAERELDVAGFTILPGPVPTEDLAHLGAIYDAIMTSASPDA